MQRGAIIENNQIGTLPADTSFEKLKAMKARSCGLLWTGGTRHTRAVYDRLERELDRPEYIVRVGGHYQTPEEWRADAYAAWGEIPESARTRSVFTFGNEPNLEGWEHDPEGYGRTYNAVRGRTPLPVLFACPSLGIDGWAEWLTRALAAVGGKPRYGIINLYAENVGRIGDFIGMFGELFVGEVNSSPWMQGGARVEFMGQAFGTLSRAGVKAALIFIVGGQSHGAWDDRYILSIEEARGIGALGDYEGGSMDDPRVAQILEQNALINEGFKRILQGRFTGADGLAGIVVALQGGPLNFEPSWPPKN